MLFLTTLLLCGQLTGSFAIPTRSPLTYSHAVRQIDTRLPYVIGAHRSNKPRGVQTTRDDRLLGRAEAATPPVNATLAAAPAGAVEGGAGAEELLLNGTFNTPIFLAGGNIKTDILYPPSAVGAFEAEVQSVNQKVVTVSENTSPAAPPAGFDAIETSSYIITLMGGAEGLTVQKVDYIFDVTNPAIAAVNLAQTRVGKLVGDAFVIADPTFGELEFEADENEITLTVEDINGEWGIFVPQAAAVNAAAVAADANATAVAAANETAAAVDVAEGAVATEEDEVVLEGAFDEAIAVPGGNAKTDIVFPPSEAGAFEVEYNGTAENTITVVQHASPAPPPEGFLFIDPVTFQVTTGAVTNPVTDVVKIDYFFSDAVAAVADASQGVIGKLDPATNTFITEGVGELEFEAEEKEFTLTVDDLNGEWAILIPRAALAK